MGDLLFVGFAFLEVYSYISNVMFNFDGSNGYIYPNEL